MCRAVLMASISILALAALGAARYPGSFRPAQPAEPSAAVVAHWRFDGPVGEAPSDESSIADLTGRFKGAVFGKPVYRRVENRVGLEFTGRDDRIAVPYAPEFALQHGMTLEAMIRYDGPVPGTIDQQQILFWGDDRPGMDPWFLAVTNEGHLVFHICGDGGDRKVQLLSPQQVPPGKLIHVAGTLDGNINEMRLYMDGKCVGFAVTDLRPMTQASSDASNADKFSVGIGNIQSGTYPEGFNGLICEARISNRALGLNDMLKAPPLRDPSAKSRKIRPDRLLVP